MGGRPGAETCACAAVSAREVFQNRASATLDLRMYANPETLLWPRRTASGHPPRRKNRPLVIGRRTLILLAAGVALVTVLNSCSGLPDSSSAVSPGTQFPGVSSPGLISVGSPTRLVSVAAPSTPQSMFPGSGGSASARPLASLAYESGTLHVGVGPWWTTLDTRNGELFVAERGSNNVTVLNGSTDKIVGSVRTGETPMSAVYDPADDTVVTLNAGGGMYPANATVVNASSLKVEGNISLPDTSSYATFDPLNGLVYASGVGGRVMVIAPSSRQVVDNITLGNSGSGGIVFDGEDGDLYVAGLQSDDLTAIGGLNDTPFGSIPVSDGPTVLAFDNRSGELFSTNAADTVSEIDPITERVTGTVSVGSSPYGLDYDGYDDRVYVANAYSSNVSVLDASTDALLGSVSVGSTPIGVTYDPENQQVYVDCTGSDTVTYLAGPLRAHLGLSAPAVDVGIPVDLTVSATGGISPYVESNWSLGDGTAPPGGPTNVTHGYEAPGTYEVNVTVTDAKGLSLTEHANLTVEPAPEVGAPNASRRSADIGQSVAFTATASFGVPPYEAYNWSDLPIGCGGTTATVVCEDLSVAEPYEVAVSVTDADGVESVPSPPSPFTVFLDPNSTVPVANRSSLDVGQSVEFTSTALGAGSGSESFTWQTDPTVLSCPPSTTLVLQCVAVGPGAPWVNVTSADSNGGRGVASFSNVTVFADPTVGAPRLSSSEIDLGASLKINGSASEGSGGFTYVWHDLPEGCVPTGATVSCVPTVAGGANLSVTATDSNGFSVTSSPSALLVNPALSGGLPGAPSQGLVGAPLTFHAQPEGGSGQYRFAWAFGDGTTASGAQVQHAYTRADSYTLHLWINDTANGTFETSWAVAVTSPASSSNSGRLGPYEIELIGGIGAAAVAVLAIVLLMRRRRASPRPPPRRAKPEPARPRSKAPGTRPPPRASNLVSR
jgi:YVTN family beta-propeller protein